LKVAHLAADETEIAEAGNPFSFAPATSGSRLSQSPMTHQSKIRFKTVGILVLTGVALVGLVAFCSTPSDPICNGIRLGQVLKNDELWTFSVAFEVPGINSFVVDYNRASLEGRKCLDALHGMGEQAWPALLKDIQIKDSKIKLWLVTSWPAKIPGIGRLIPIGWVLSEQHRRMRAWYAISELLAIPGEVDRTDNPKWRGIDGLPPSFQKKAALDVTCELKRRLMDYRIHGSHEDKFMASCICDLIGRIGAKGRLAIPVLRQAGLAQIGAAQVALFRLGYRDATPIYTRHMTFRPSIPSPAQTRP
jgi:hypothetical protein